MTKIFSLSREIAFVALIKLNSKNQLKKQNIYIPLYKFYQVSLFLTTCIGREELQKSFFYISKKEENQYINNVAFFCCITMRKQGRVPLEDITEEEEGILSSKSDPKLDLNKDGNLYLY